VDLSHAAPQHGRGGSERPSAGSAGYVVGSWADPPTMSPRIDEGDLADFMPDLGLIHGRPHQQHVPGFRGLDLAAFVPFAHAHPAEAEAVEDVDLADFVPSVAATPRQHWAPHTHGYPKHHVEDVSVHVHDLRFGVPDVKPSGDDDDCLDFVPSAPPRRWGVL